MKTRIIFLVTLICVILFTQNQTFAHCDTMDWPVILAAKKSLETKNPNYFLIWVQKKDEPIILKEFNKTLSLRLSNPENLENIDKSFFENLVKIHRVWEWAEYTGLKPAWTITNPVIILWDKSFETKNSSELEEFLAKTITNEVKHRFKEVIEKQNYALDNIEAGREYIAEYITFLHWSEWVYEMMNKKISHHIENWVSEKNEAHEENFKNNYKVKSWEIKNDSHIEELNKDEIYKIILILLVGIMLGVIWSLLLRK